MVTLRYFCYTALTANGSFVDRLDTFEIHAAVADECIGLVIRACGGEWKSLIPGGGAEVGREEELRKLVMMTYFKVDGGPPCLFFPPVTPQERGLDSNSAILGRFAQ